MLYGKKSGNCDIELVRETVSTQKIRELYSSARGRVPQVCGKYKPKVPKHCTYFYFVLSLLVYSVIWTVSRVLIRFFSYKLEFSQILIKARIKLLFYTHNTVQCTVPEIIDTVFAKTSPKRLFSMTEYERFGLVFTKTRVYKFGHSTKYSFLKCSIENHQESLV